MMKKIIQEHPICTSIVKFLKNEKEVKKIQHLLGEIVQNVGQFSEHLQELKKM